MNALTEAIEILQIAAATRTTAGLGRALRLLERVQAQYFTDAEDVAEIAGETCHLCGKPTQPWENQMHKVCVDHEHMLADLAQDDTSRPWR
jgi:hypothetical protein